MRVLSFCVDLQKYQTLVPTVTQESGPQNIVFATITKAHILAIMLFIVHSMIFACKV